MSAMANLKEDLVSCVKQLSGVKERQLIVKNKKIILDFNIIH